MEKNRKNFILPREFFKNTFEYLKYKVGIINISRDKELQFILNYSVAHFGLDKITVLNQESEDIPRGYKYLLTSKNMKFNAVGDDFADRDIALSKALGEYIERACFFLKNTSELTRKFSIKELRDLYDLKIFSDFNTFVNPKTKVFPETDEETNEKVDCVLAYEHIEKKSVLYPFQHVFYGENTTDSKYHFFPQNSNGCAGGFSKNQALLSSLYELVERDAFILHWHTKTPSKKILVGTLPEEIKEKVNYFRKYGLELSFYNITTDIKIPTVMCIMVDKYSKEMRGLVSSSTKKTFSEAILSSIREAHIVSYFFTKEENWNLDFLDSSGAYHENESIGDHKRMSLLQEKNMQHFKFIFDGGEVDYNTIVDEVEEKNSLQDEFEWAISKVSIAMPQVRIYSMVLKNPYLARIGYYVGRVLIPNLITIYLKETNKFINNARVDTFLKHKNKKVGELNNFPHPFG